LLCNQVLYSFNIFFTIIALFALTGTVLLWQNIYKNLWNCPKCNGKKTLIKLDTSEAIEIIKENNLSFPDESAEEDKFPWEIKS